ncbi:MAG: SDR family oxidoreductase [Deltaproteobacteria bacterium]|nr:SDR family oxidoreductase [Deltaproteobacteria bacterium]
MQADKWILVTGASTGIGRAAVDSLAAGGFNVYACARKTRDLDELAGIDNVVPIELDVTDTDQINSALKFVQQKKSGLFGVLNNAGIAEAGPLMDLDVKILRRQFEVNFFGVHEVTRAFFPLLLESKGRIVMMSSDSGFFATPFAGPYCASKFALEGYSDSLRRELIDFGVEVVLIQPGRVKTPIWDKGVKFLSQFPGSIFEKTAVTLGKHAFEKGKTSGLEAGELGKVVQHVFQTKRPKTRYLVSPNNFKYYMVKILSDRRVDRMVQSEIASLMK